MSKNLQHIKLAVTLFTALMGNGSLNFSLGTWKPWVGSRPSRGGGR